MKIRAILGAMVLLVSGQVGASTIKVEFTGTVSDVYTLRGFEVGDIFEATFTYDADLPTHSTSISTNPQSYYYQGLTAEPLGMTGTLDGVPFQTIYQDEFAVTNGSPDKFTYLARNIYLDGVFLGSGSAMSFAAIDNTGQSFSGTEFPTLDELTNGTFDQISLSIMDPTGGDQNLAAHAFGTITVSAVPAPPALLLFGTGIIGLIGFSKRRKAIS